MTEPRADLRLLIDNLGPLGHAEVSLRPLTVLIGRNNTGKTYLAQALYAARRAVRNGRRHPSDPLTTEERTSLSDLILRLTVQESVGAPGDDLRLELKELPQSVQARVTSWIVETLGDVGRSLERQLCATFGVQSTQELNRWGQTGDVGVELHRVDGIGQRSCIFGTNGSSVAGVEPELEVDLDPFDFHPEVSARRLEDGPFDEDDGEKWLNQVASADLRGAAWQGYRSALHLTGGAHYLPAGRSGLLNAWTDVVRLRIELERESLGLQTIREPALDGVALDFISSLAGLLGTRSRVVRGRASGWRSVGWQRSRRRSGPTSGSLGLLREVMEGEIYSGSGDDKVPTLEYRQGKNRIAIRRASSMVADLAPLAMWIDRIVEPGDLLIVDEPESHLHPGAIRLVARVLVRLVAEGVSVVCATHSPVLLHELSNCLLLSQQGSLDDQDTEQGYEMSDCLSPNDLAVHRFRRSDPDGPVEVVQVEIEPDWGIPEDEYVDVATEQSERTSQLIDSQT
jgi:hypothetical protein